MNFADGRKEYNNTHCKVYNVLYKSSLVVFSIIMGKRATRELSYWSIYLLYEHKQLSVDSKIVSNRNQAAPLLLELSEIQYINLCTWQSFKG